MQRAWHVAWPQFECMDERQNNYPHFAGERRDPEKEVTSQGHSPSAGVLLLEPRSPGSPHFCAACKEYFLAISGDYHSESWYPHQGRVSKIITGPALSSSRTPWWLTPLRHPQHGTAWCPSLYDHPAFLEAGPRTPCNYSHSPRSQEGRNGDN